MRALVDWRKYEKGSLRNFRENEDKNTIRLRDHQDVVGLCRKVYAHHIGFRKSGKKASAKNRL